MFRLAATPRFAATFASAGAGAPPEQADIVALRTDLTLSGARAANVDKEFGVDAPPTGVTVTLTMVTVGPTFVGDGATLPGESTAPANRLLGWDFAGRLLTINVGATCKLVDCVVESPGWGATETQLVNVYGAAGFERCTFRGDPGHYQIAMAVRWQTGSTPIGRTARCRFLEFIADSYKPHPSEIIEWCYFGCPVHAPAGTVAWDSGTTYAAGDFALDGSGNIFLSLVGSNLDNALPAAGEANASWLGLAPHSDALTFDRAEAITFRRSLIDNHPTPPETVPDATVGIVAPNGINNAWRTVRNALDSSTYGSVSIDRVAVYRDGGASFPLQSEDGLKPGFNGPIRVTNCWLSAKAGGAYVYPDGEWDVWAGNVDYTSGDPVVVATRTRAAPVNTIAPSISGTPTVGETLTGATGTWTGQPIPSLARQWLRNGAPIPGATSETYVLAGGDGGAEVSLRVTATSVEGSAVAESAAETISTTPTFATEITLAPFATGPGGAAPVFSGRRELNSGLVFVSGSGEAGEVVQGRMVRASDGEPVSAWVEIGTTDGGDGSFEGYITGAPRSFDALKAEVGYAEAANTPAQTSNSCYIGWVMSIWAQSDLRCFGDTNFGGVSATPTVALHDNRVRFVAINRDPLEITPADAGDLIVLDVAGSPPANRDPIWRWANTAMELLPDGPIILMGHAVSDSNDRQTVDDGSNKRIWEDEVLVVQAGQPHLVETDRPVAIDLVWWAYSSSANYVTEAQAVGIIGRLAFGVDPSGDPIAPGTEITEFGGSFAYTQDHSWAEIYDWTHTKLGFREHPNPPATLALEGFVDHPVYGDKVFGPPFLFSTQWLTNGTRQPDGTWLDPGHASNGNVGGFSEIAALAAAGMAYTMRAFDPGDITLDKIVWPVNPGDDPKYVHVGIDGRNITTMRELYAAMDPPFELGTGEQPLGEVAGFLINDARATETALVTHEGFRRIRIAKNDGSDWSNADELTFDPTQINYVDLAGYTQDEGRDTYGKFLDVAIVESGLSTKIGLPLNGQFADNFFANPIPAASGVAFTVLDHATFGAATASTPETIATITGHNGAKLLIWVATDSSSGADAGYPTAATLGGETIYPQTIRAASADFKINLFHVAAPGTGDLDLDITFGADAFGGTVQIVRVDSGEFGSPPTVASTGGSPTTTMAPGVASPQGGSTALHMIMSSGAPTVATLGGTGDWDDAAVEFASSHWTRLGVVEDVGSGSASGFSVTFSPGQRVLHSSTFIRPPAE